MGPQEDYSLPPKDKPELLRRIEREWNALEQTFSNLDDRRMGIPDAGGWSIKDNLAHITAWEHFMRLAYLQKIPATEVMGIDAETYQQLDETKTNAIIFQRNKDRTVKDVLAGFREEHENLLAELGKMSFEDMLVPLDPENPQKGPLLNWIIGNTYDHYLEHRRTIEKFAIG